uniref:Uncharacterized protein n=1 Tax=viral metagenome TaxID=1070528 RepID=A0A6C0L042_9ZZZZ|tara:strand:- start:1333 stop:1572 length:240 start_codon:yes stop_codon:yes gene_type:complete
MKNTKIWVLKKECKNDCINDFIYSKVEKMFPLSKGENYGDIADSGRRPRGCFYEIFKPKLEDHCNLIFDGHISKLDNLF